jgi:PAS domain S-box-containing protein
MDSKQILVIDNDKFYLELFSDILQEEGYSVKKASDGLQGLELVRKEPFYCIFVDLVMPRIDGAKFIKCIREDPKLKEIPVIIVSAAISDESSDLEKIKADFYLFKGPVEEIKKNTIKILKRIEGERKEVGDISPVFGIKGMYKRAVVSELMSVKKHWEVVLENMGEAVIETDTDLKITYVNSTAKNIFKKSEGQIIGIHLYELFKTESLLKIKAAIEKLSSSLNSQVETLTIPYDKYVLKIVIANLIEDNKNIGIVLIAEDVTAYHTKVRELMLANERLKKMQDRLVQEAKFSMLGHLSATITREIENPLISALSYITLLLRGKKKDETIHNKLEIIQEEIQRARSMIRDLIDFGGGEESKLDWIEVNEILQKILSLIKHRADSLNVKIVENYDKNLPSIYADADKLKQVFINLINNAFEAMPHGGTLTITTLIAADESYSPTEAKNCIQIKFADTGEGISPEFLPQIFNPFFSAKPDRHATGLGLSTSLKAIQDLGGTIEVDSKVGVGSTFTVKIPLLNESIEK